MSIEERNRILMLERRVDELTSRLNQLTDRVVVLELQEAQKPTLKLPEKKSA